ncbi:hypothetical protein SCHPADRAFT_742008 [Schizopora paradoxa]|uniref:Uncharacterized protein n=1 Tax=Schizopora paradoxa TaxID=27342 RepID=A0A0H2R0Z3_9AGAM|nr:hypothetical protein SCHPADRAFT_742008 [Schizopora paradoxa]
MKIFLRPLYNFLFLPSTLKLPSEYFMPTFSPFLLLSCPTFLAPSNWSIHEKRCGSRVLRAFSCSRRAIHTRGRWMAMLLYLQQHSPCTFAMFYFDLIQLRRNLH